MKEKLLESYINNSGKKQLELFFGDGSKVEVKQTFYLTQKKIDQVEIKVFFTDPEVSINYWPQNVNWVVEDAWKFVNGSNSKCIVQATYEVI
jgi:hypothetical protein